MSTKLHTPHLMHVIVHHNNLIGVCVYVSDWSNSLKASFNTVR